MIMVQFNQKRKVKTVSVIVRCSNRNNQWICSSNLCWLGDFEKIICPCKEGRGVVVVIRRCKTCGACGQKSKSNTFINIYIKNRPY